MEGDIPLTKLTKKNVIFFVTSLNSGGVENYLLRFLQYGSGGFNKILIFCKSGRKGQLLKNYNRIENVEVVARKMGYFNLISLYYIYQLYKKDEYHVICDFTGNFAGLILLIAKWANIPKRVSFYRGSTNHFKETKLRLLYSIWSQSLVHKNATDILSNSQAAFNFFYPKKWKEDIRFKIIYNGARIEDFLEEKGHLREELGIPKKAFVVGHTGRFNSAKNHSTIIAVAERLVIEHHWVYFILCGNGVEKNLAPIIKEKGLSSKVLVFENRSDIPRFLNTLDAFFFPSVTEGQPNALIEAMISGLPFVASDIAPIKETVPQEAIHQLIDPFDIDAAVNKICAIMQQKQNFTHAEWARKQFESKSRFEEFKQVLLKNEG